MTRRHATLVVCTGIERKRGVSYYAYVFFFHKSVRNSYIKRCIKAHGGIPQMRHTYNARYNTTPMFISSIYKELRYPGKKQELILSFTSFQRTHQINVVPSLPDISSNPLPHMLCRPWQMIPSHSEKKPEHLPSA